MIDEEFQSKVEDFIERHDLSPTTFGLWALNDSRFVFDLRNGRACFGKTMRKVYQFMAEHEEKIEARRKRQATAASAAPVALTPCGRPTVRDVFGDHAGAVGDDSQCEKRTAARR